MDNILRKDDWILRYTLNSAVPDDYDGSIVGGTFTSVGGAPGGVNMAAAAIEEVGRRCSIVEWEKEKPSRAYWTDWLIVMTRSGMAWE